MRQMGRRRPSSRGRLRLARRCARLSILRSHRRMRDGRLSRVGGYLPPSVDVAIPGPSRPPTYRLGPRTGGVEYPALGASILRPAMSRSAAEIPHACRIMRPPRLPTSPRYFRASRRGGRAGRFSPRWTARRAYGARAAQGRHSTARCLEADDAASIQR